MNQPTYRHFPLHSLRTPLIALAVAAYLTGCASVTDKGAQKTPPTQTARGEDKPAPPPYKGGGYYKDDGPGRDIPSNLDQVPDAVPKAEPLHRYANNTYKVMGKSYQPMSAERPYKEKGLASWYGRKFHGKNTSSGEPYDMYAMTAAHATLPIPSYARVTNQNTGQSVLVRINDRGPFHEGRIIDLSYTAAYKLDVLRDVTPVEVELLSADAAPDSFTAQAGEVQTSSPISEASTPAAGEAIYLQLGAYANPASAEALLARAGAMLSRDLPGVTRLEVGGLHKVQAGPFMSADAADKAAERIREELDVRAIKVSGKAPASTATIATIVPTAAAPGIYLQLAALSNSVAADALSAKVKGRFGGELPGISHLPAGNLIKVQAGPFASADAAEQMALAYQQDFGVKPYKVRR
ncbi:MAG: septal ring lytic transglycosylase RlpA family protein [Pseudomonadota bacterium]|nr:septal ring lytic transglycosylase RlpA family protein [Pseudomonadota bacterium]